MENKSNLHILLAEDNLINQKLAQRLLEKLGYRVDVVGDGAAAVKAVANLPYDLVLMDIQMPEMDGWEATAAIRRHESGTGRHVPIIALTAHDTSSDREQCQAAGMDGYLVKPFQPQEVAAVMGRWLKVKD